MYFCMPDDDHQTSALSGCACCKPLIQSVTQRINADLSRRGFVAGIGASLATLGLCAAPGRSLKQRPRRSSSRTSGCSTDDPGVARRARLLVERDGSRRSRPATVGPEGAHDRLRRPHRDAGH